MRPSTTCAPRAARIILRFLFACLGVPAAAADYVVSTTGSDLNPGTLEAPWRTIQHAMNTAPAGATVSIRGGTYLEPTLSVNVSGTAGHVTTFQPYGFGETSAGEPVVLDYASLGTVAADTTPRLTISGRSYVRIQGLAFRNFTCTGAMKQGIRIDGGATDIEFLRNTITGFRNVGPWDGSSALLLLYVWDTDRVTIGGNEIGDVATNYSEALTLSNGARGTLVEGNWIHDTDAIGIDAARGATGWTIRGNRLEYVSVKRDGTIWYGNGAVAVYCDGANSGVMERNVVDHAGVAFEALAEPGNEPAYDVTIRDNVAAHCTSAGVVLGTWYSDSDGSSVHDIALFNNTFYRDAVGLLVRPMTSSTVRWENNLFAENSVSYVNTLGWDPGTVGFNLYSGGGVGPGAAVTADPRFTDPANGDFSLQATSPARDAGDPGTTASQAGSDDFAGGMRIVGDRIDIGAAEFQMSTTTGGTTTGGTTTGTTTGGTAGGTTTGGTTSASTTTGGTTTGAAGGSTGGTGSSGGSGHGGCGHGAASIATALAAFASCRGRRRR